MSTRNYCELSGKDIYKLSPCSVYVTLRQSNTIHKKGSFLKKKKFSKVTYQSHFSQIQLVLIKEILKRIVQRTEP